MLPPPTLYDPADDQETPLLGERTGTVVLFLTGDADRRWAGRAAMALCTAWARGGRRIVLADLDVESPLLHELAGVENLEGFVDVFLYGASIARSARPVEGRAFFLIPAGTYTPDARAIYRHPRWPKLVAGFRDAGASLVLFGSADSVDLGALSEWISYAILLGAPADAESVERLAAAEVEIRALIVQPGVESSGRVTSPPPVFAPPPAEAPAPPPPAAPTPAPTTEPEPVRRGPDAALSLPPAPVRERRRTRGLAGLLWFLLALAVMAAAGYIVTILRPDLVRWPALGGASADTAPAVIPPATARPAPTPAGEPLPYSVQVIAFQSFDAARERLLAQRESLEDVPVLIAPEEIQGIRYYKILAGALEDTAAARALRERLVEVGAVEEEDAAGAWTLIQETPLAFDLGEYATRDSATSAGDSLLALNIPAYSLPLAYSDGTRRWRVYGGAYRDTASAAAMGELLSSAGLTPRLVARTGSAAAVE